MARRRRNEGSPVEIIAGLVIFFVGMPMISPRVRTMYLSALPPIIAFITIAGVIGLLIYLIIQALKAKNEPVPAHVKRSTLSRPADRYTGGPSLNFETEKQPALTNGSILSDEDRGGIKSLYESSLPTTELTSASQSSYTRSWDVSVLREIEWKRFETVCTEFLKLAGFIAKETKIGADGGVDIRVCKSGVENSDGIVQCKAWNTYKVGIKPIRELFGVMAAERVSTGIFMTSGIFTSEAEEFAKGKITLISGEKFISLVKKRSDDDQKNLLDIALEGDYKTPTCPQCDIKMTLRESKTGRNAGSKFWGCVKYPRCKQNLIYKEA